MNVLLISDIHSNISALEAVVRDAKIKFEIDEVWALGDLVGYGPDPAACLDFLDSIDAVCVAGNHDHAVAGIITTEWFNPIAAAAVDWTAESLDSTHLDQLKALPEVIERHGITLVHGSPRAPMMEYVYSELVAQDAINDTDTAGVAVGHTHLAAIYEQREGLTRGILIDRSRPYSFAGVSFLVNPGSVGQPRDNDPRASYAVLDLDEETITHRRVDYDFELTAQRIRDAKLPEFLADRLASGR